MNLLSTLEKLGVTCHLDWDDELLVECPESVPRSAILALIQEYDLDLTCSLIGRARHAMECFVGGPFHGERQGPCSYGEWFARRVGPRRWAAYEQLRDGRAMFRGYASSEKNAKRRKLIPVEEKQ